MMIEHKLTLTGLLVATALAQSAGAANLKVQFAGCVLPGVKHGCTIVTSGGKVFNITAARPLPDYKRGLGIMGSGTATGKVSFCMQGPVLGDIKWTYTKQKCDVPRNLVKRKP